jgi:MYXO-CTERM domain-containing protein
MKRFLFASTAIVAAAASFSQASPTINGAHINARVFNDMPGTTFTPTNAFPGSITLAETLPPIPSGSNLHNFRLSADGGASNAVFANLDHFSISADVSYTTSSGNGEAGLNVSPWYSSNVDGQFHIRPSDGEVAAFGGRLPFFSFTGAFGSHYVNGSTVHMSIEVVGVPGNPTHSMVQYGYGSLFSGWIPFDEGNISEGPIYGNWGVTNGAAVGGYMQDFGQLATQTSTAVFGNVAYSSVPAPTAAGLLGLGGLLAARRRR